MPANKKQEGFTPTRPAANSLWGRAEREGKLLFHHTRPLAHCHYDLVLPVRLTQVLPQPLGCPPAGKGWCQWDDWHDALHMEAAYRWLSEQVGFWPLFLAVGDDEEALRMTGYDGQFGRILTRSREKTTYRAAGDFPSDVLFSFKRPPQSTRFSDYQNWHLPLNSASELARHYHHCKLPDYLARMVTRPSWSDTRWLRQALQDPHSVQAVVPQLDLRDADLIRCRSLKAKRELVARGFCPDQIEVLRLEVRRWW